MRSGPTAIFTPSGHEPSGSSRAPSLTDPLLSQLSETLGTAYTIERELGGGGMSRVFVALETRLRRKVVVKVLSPELAAGVSAERFEREIQLAAALQQANIVPVLSTGDTNGLPYYTMPFVEGLSLRDRLARNGAMPVSEVVSVLRDVTRALAYAHEHGVVHRDIKPENILLSGDAAVVTDFGIAKALSASRTRAPEGTLTQVGTSIGTPAYMAPEQAAGDPNIDHRADLYALGCVVYEMLVGTPPFHGKPVHQIFAAHMTEAPQPVSSRRSDVPPALAQLVMRCLAKDADQRPQSAREVLLAFDGATSGERAFAARPASRRNLVVGALGLVAIAGGLFAATRRITTSPEGDRSIAVLPFTNAGNDSAQAYFAEGVAEELTTSLARLPGLRVASRSAAFATARHSASAQEAGRTLKVATVLDGTVRRSGKRLRITAQLTNVADGFALWSDAFDRDTGDVFTAQDELSRRITSALHDKLLVGTTAAVTTDRGTADPQSYDLYLRGRYFWLHRGEANLRRAALLFSQAIGRDSSFARAWAGLALVQVVLPEYTASRQDTLYARGMVNSARAIRLDSTVSDAFLARGYGMMALWKLDSAETNLRHALALSPNDPSVHQWYGDMLQASGRPLVGLDQLQQAQRLDPTSGLLAVELAFTYMTLHRYDEALVWARRSIELDPMLSNPYSFAAMSFAYLHQVDSTRLMVSLEMSKNNGVLPAWDRGHVAAALAVAGQRDEARMLATRLDADARKGIVGNFIAAEAHAALGETDTAIYWLTRSADAHEYEPFIYVLVCFPPFESLESDPRYKILLKRFGLTGCVRQ